MRIKPFNVHVYRAEDPRVQQHDRKVNDPLQGPARPVPGKTMLGLRFSRGKLPTLEPRQAPTYVNPLLGAICTNGSKQYTFDGQALFDPYPHGAPKPEKAAGRARKKIGEGRSHTVEAKYNAESPVHRKVPHQKNFRTNLTRVMEHNEVTNDLAKVLLRQDDETRRMAQHFAIEVLKEVRYGQPVYYTRAVNGFTLQDYQKNPSAYPELPMASLETKRDELCAAIGWLYGKGFMHSALHVGNMMYDRETGKLVLIDMDRPKRAGPRNPDT